MADELKISQLDIYCKLGSHRPLELLIPGTYIDVSGNVYQGISIQSVGTSAEVLVINTTDLTTIGFVYIRNLDSANYIEAGDDADNPTLKMLAGEYFWGRWGASTISVKANTSACLVEYAVIEA